MKRILLLLLAFTLAFSFFAFAEGEISITVNSNPITMDVPPEIMNGRTMVPMRAIFEKLGADVSWAGADQLIFATKGKTFITMKIGVPQMVVQTTDSDESEVITLDTAPFIDSDYTLIPVRAVAEALSTDVDWIDETRTVVITNSKGTLD